MENKQKVLTQGSNQNQVESQVSFPVIFVSNLQNIYELFVGKSYLILFYI